MMKSDSILFLSSALAPCLQPATAPDAFAPCCTGMENGAKGLFPGAFNRPGARCFGGRGRSSGRYASDVKSATPGGGLSRANLAAGAGVVTTFPRLTINRSRRIENG